MNEKRPNLAMRYVHMSILVACIIQRLALCTAQQAETSVQNYFELITKKEACSIRQKELHGMINKVKQTFPESSPFMKEVTDGTADIVLKTLHRGDTTINRGIPTLSVSFLCQFIKDIAQNEAEIIRNNQPSEQASQQALFFGNIGADNFRARLHIHLHALSDASTKALTKLYQQHATCILGLAADYFQLPACENDLKVALRNISNHSLACAQRLTSCVLASPAYYALSTPYQNFQTTYRSVLDRQSQLKTYTQDGYHSLEYLRYLRLRLEIEAGVLVSYNRRLFENFDRGSLVKSWFSTAWAGILHRFGSDYPSTHNSRNMLAEFANIQAKIQRCESIDTCYEYYSKNSKSEMWPFVQQVFSAQKNL